MAPRSPEPALLVAPVRWLAVASFAASLALVLPAMLRVADAADTPVLWYAERATGFVAYVALWASLFTGSLVSARGVEGLLSRKWLMDFHQQWSLAAVVAVAAHVAVTVAHSYSDVTLTGALVPYASSAMRVPIALGTAAMWGLALVAGSSWLRTRIPYAWWRAVHALSFGLAMLALAHSAEAGSDTALWPVRLLYVLTAALAVGAVVARALVSAGRHARA